MKGTLYTSYFAKLNKGIGIKISIARYNPKWLKPTDLDYWFKDLAPEKQLLNDYKYKGLSWEKYVLRYNSQINIKKPLQYFLLKRLLDNGKDVTIYCHEGSNDNCHRHLLSNMFSELGYNVEEIK